MDAWDAGFAQVFTLFDRMFDADFGGGDTEIDEAVRAALFVNLLTEDNLPYYFRDIDRSDVIKAANTTLERQQASARLKPELDQLHASFQAGEGMDREWAKRTMTLMFMRYTNIKIVAITRNNRIDTGSSQVGHTQAKVLVTGAQGLIPERAEPYAIALQWRLDGSQWKLIELRWE